MNGPARGVRLVRAIAERVPLEKLSFEELVTKKVVPLHRMSWAYYLGGLSLLFAGIQFVTGLMLLFYYRPTVSDAHASMENIEKYVTGAEFIRNLHIWGASFLLFFLLAHMLTTFAMKAFARPRELTWLFGFGLFLIVFAFGYTGYLLPWDQVGVNATKIVFQSITKTGQYLPGPFSQWPGRIRDILQGAPSVGQDTLSRMYALHVVILPLLLIGFLGVHLLLVQLHGMSPGVSGPPRKEERFFPFFILKDFSLWGIAFFIVFILAIALPFDSFSPYPLFEAYDPLGGTPDGIKPEWYFYSVYYPLEILPFGVVTLGLLLLMLALLLTPLIFRRVGRRWLGALAVAALFYLVVITIFGEQIRNWVKGGGGA